MKLNDIQVGETYVAMSNAVFNDPHQRYNLWSVRKVKVLAIREPRNIGPRWDRRTKNDGVRVEFLDGRTSGDVGILMPSEVKMLARDWDEERGDWVAEQRRAAELRDDLRARQRTALRDLLAGQDRLPVTIRSNIDDDGRLWYPTHNLSNSDIIRLLEAAYAAGQQNPLPTN